MLLILVICEQIIAADPLFACGNSFIFSSFPYGERAHTNFRSFKDFVGGHIDLIISQDWVVGVLKGWGLAPL